jgi:hypothetical protein
MEFTSQADTLVVSQQDEVSPRSESRLFRRWGSYRRHPADAYLHFQTPIQNVALGMPIVAMGHEDCGDCHCHDIPSLCIAYETWTEDDNVPRLFFDTNAYRYWATDYWGLV